MFNSFSQYIIKGFSKPIKHFIKIYLKYSEQEIQTREKERVLLKRIILQLKEFIHKRNNMFKFFPFSHARTLSKVKYISNLKEFYSNKLSLIKYKTITPKIKIKFDEDEKTFLNIINSKINNLIFKDNYHPKHYSHFNYQREVFSCVFRSIEFVGASGILIHNGKGILESAFSSIRLNYSKKFFSFVFKKKIKKGVYTSIMHWDFANNYYHFLIDNLSRMYILEKINEPKINLIVPKNYNKFYLDILKLFLDGRFEIVEIDLDEVWELEKFYFASFCAGDYPNSKSHIPKTYLDFLKKKLFDIFSIKKSLKRNKRIYISRSKASSRRILNENDLINLLKKYDFDIVHSEDLIFKDQIELFNSVSIVVSPLGAGLTNIIFSQNIKVIELFPLNFIRPEYFMICKELGFIYRYLIGRDRIVNQDFHVDIGKLEEILIEIINN